MLSNCRSATYWWKVCAGIWTHLQGAVWQLGGKGLAGRRPPGGSWRSRGAGCGRSRGLGKLRPAPRRAPSCIRVQRRKNSLQHLAETSDKFPWCWKTSLQLLFFRKSIAFVDLFSRIMSYLFPTFSHYRGFESRAALFKPRTRSDCEKFQRQTERFILQPFNIAIWRIWQHEIDPWVSEGMLSHAAEVLVFWETLESSLMSSNQLDRWRD